MVMQPSTKILLRMSDSDLYFELSNMSFPQSEATSWQQESGTEFFLPMGVCLGE